MKSLIRGKQQEIDKVASTVLFSDNTEEEYENPDREARKKRLYGETGFGALRGMIRQQEYTPNLRQVTVKVNMLTNTKSIPQKPPGEFVYRIPQYPHYTCNDYELTYTSHRSIRNILKKAYKKAQYAIKIWDRPPHSHINPRTSWKIEERNVQGKRWDKEKWFIRTFVGGHGTPEKIDWGYELLVKVEDINANNELEF